jgi:capsular polysaccharide biosynthesis protein
MIPGHSNPAADFDDDDQTSFERRAPTLVSLNFVRTALRRRLLVCVMSAALGLLAAGTFMVAFPPAHQAKAALVLTHDADVDPSRAMATNVSLLQTRTVASRTIAGLGLAVAPEDFLKSVTVEAVSAELLSVTLSAPDDAEAVRRLDGLTSTYLQFRAEQLSLQSQILVDGMQERIAKLQRDVEDLSRRVEQLSAAGNSSASKLSDTVAQRAYLQGRIETLQQAVEDATLRNSAVVSSSRVLDPPAAVPGLAKRTIALGMASGLIGGAALGCGTVLFIAITSDRLRRRADVASALGVPVPVSVGRIATLRKGWRWLPPLRALDRRRADGRQRFAHAIVKELLLPQGRGRVAVAGIDNSQEVGFAVAAAAATIAARYCSITVIDLTERLSRGLRVTPSTPGSYDLPTVLRPRGLPALAHGAADLLALGHWDNGENTPLPQLTDATLVLAELDPAVGADHLTAWADRVILVVTAGRSSVEKVRTVADMIRTAGLDLRFAVLMHTERRDDSSGTANVELPEPVELSDDHDGTDDSSETANVELPIPVQLRDDHDDAESIEKSEVR